MPRRRALDPAYVTYVNTAVTAYFAMFVSWGDRIVPPSPVNPYEFDLESYSHPTAGAPFDFNLVQANTAIAGFHPQLQAFFQARFAELAVIDNRHNPLTNPLLDVMSMGIVELSELFGLLSGRNPALQAKLYAVYREYGSPANAAVIMNANNLKLFINVAAMAILSLDRSAPLMLMQYFRCFVMNVYDETQVNLADAVCIAGYSLRDLFAFTRLIMGRYGTDPALYNGALFTRIR